MAAGVANANFGTPNFALARYEGTPFPDLTGAWNSLSQICRTTPRGLQRCRLAGRVNVMNQGTVRVPRASFLRFFLSSDGITPETFLRQVAVGALRAGQTQGKRLSVALPIGTTATGKFVLAILDFTNVITETDKTNNMIVFGPLP
ncbi:MAG: hypothetical protein M5R38_00820 [Candidatus Methylomirabilis sp.]|nr:hypothetical protein [Candidatus Methylomirabilis sp.]